MSETWSVAGLWQPALGWPRLRCVEARGRLRRMMETLAPFGFIYLGILVDAATIVGPPMHLAPSTASSPWEFNPMSNP